MAIREEQVDHVAKLAKLSFSEDELHQFTEQLGEIIDMFETLEEVDTTDVALTSNITDEINVIREDKAVKGTSRDALMKNAPESENGFIKVPAIIDDKEGGA
ncbi:Asp-tRNA(Asn)/Glu-tRNA(Gln) amidotransferase subunit GatC [Tetragenococcus koreensis]|uniref:Aspartyl/glutamyl-tRNA(Asn/Gln) amidotransferase subunit C n=1 Tax=Tetragenococcus koreensis TaxID=290335 RepID=A0AAN4UBT2_9ENTE|nr:Asp-tRNA(Asn)/Glu-tRNA(Gln) amidotransferase subunit GatC [Tetragenococcus koreensis]AYW45098.1 Asp-tRNA(Asn)/Glu-tRNA(Gln) amidotransferase GatCAB subunit C [Tetragenococcus koreensis]MCF1584336.1 Asp-tRNA(Asn)/Glu-tRNA(Gln) amidotransferase subunit GatC [Tetragenococcus koreensis]MCF1613885.1 Asp-tRNA(Asn)/Glu-tRNA(Gln) amidotransferase subunit GatC [Tetragenococcus koreensis]MCF1616076.1 Asp-tRNA(Asn)/Glu-tRNA(Gln) amidotransferase subunit GatC [Tetragenococcus koreensis]MCF1618572.1 Asp